MKPVLIYEVIFPTGEVKIVVHVCKYWGITYVDMDWTNDPIFVGNDVSVASMDVEEEQHVFDIKDIDEARKCYVKMVIKHNSDPD